MTRCVLVWTILLASMGLMALTDHQTAPRRPGTRAVFVTTHWSVVLSARDAASPQSAEALEQLCHAYWYPLYAYVRRCGYSPADAEDLTQAFFARLLEKQWLADADCERGRFRSFLLTSLKHFLANEWDKAHSQKRGGKIRVIPLETQWAETRYERELADEATPDKVFDRHWALALLERVLERLREEYATSGKERLFEELRSTLGGGRSEVPYAEIALRLGINEGSVKVSVHRLRQRYREILRAEIAHTVAGQEQVEEELRHLFAALSPG